MMAWSVPGSTTLIWPPNLPTNWNDSGVFKADEELLLALQLEPVHRPAVGRFARELTATASVCCGPGSATAPSTARPRR